MTGVYDVKVQAAVVVVPDNEVQEARQVDCVDLPQQGKREFTFTRKAFSFPVKSSQQFKEAIQDHQKLFSAIYGEGTSVQFVQASGYPDSIGSAYKIAWIIPCSKVRKFTVTVEEQSENLIKFQEVHQGKYKGLIVNVTLKLSDQETFTGQPIIILESLTESFRIQNKFLCCLKITGCFLCFPISLIVLQIVGAKLGEHDQKRLNGMQQYFNNYELLEAIDEKTTDKSI